jgi:hypothetical protein
VPEEKPVSLDPLDLKQALSGLLQVKPKDEKKPKRKKAPPPSEERRG